MLWALEFTGGLVFGAWKLSGGLGLKVLGDSVLRVLGSGWG